MSAQPPRRQQQRSGGGRALMLLGIVLALLSGVLVVYIVSNVTNNNVQTEQVVVVTQTVQSGTVFTVAQIQADFAVKSYPVALVPAGAYIYTSQDALNVKLNQQVAVDSLQPGDVLLTTDPRFQPVGSVGNGSLTLSNPGQLPSGSVLTNMQYTNPSNSVRSMVVAGDHVDIIVTECNAGFTTNGTCATQTTLHDIYVYATFNNSLILVLTIVQSKQLAILQQGGTIQIVLLKPGDSGVDGTPAQTPATVAAAFGF